MAVAAATVALVSACGGGSTGGGSPTAAISTATNGGAAGGSSTGSATVSTASGALGEYLTDGAGRAVYMFASDTATKSTCDGSCATVWPPLPVPSSMTVGGDAVKAQLSAITRSDGSRQLAYAGHPLYYYQGDTSPGDTTGQGSNGFGAKWWVLAPDGSPITGSSSSSSSGSGYGSGGYGY